MTKDQQEGCLVIWCMAFVISIVSFAFGILTEEKKPDLYNVIATTTADIEATETIESTTETETETETTTTTTALETTEPVTTTVIIENTTSFEPQDGSLLYLGAFTATYYNGDTVPCKGGSGRELNSCNVKSSAYKGSVASKLVYEDFGYNVDGVTTIYISFATHPELDGWYSVDDCNAVRSIIDFYFSDFSACPWENDGVIPCKAWIKE